MQTISNILLNIFTFVLEQAIPGGNPECALLSGVIACSAMQPRSASATLAQENIVITARCPDFRCRCRIA